MGDFELDFEGQLEEDIPRGLPGVPGKVVDAEYLDVRELETDDWKYRDGKRVVGLLLGYRDRDGKDVGAGIKDDRHVLTIAGSRTGKGVSLLVPNLLLYDGSAIVIDPKGELARITARARREKGQKVVILDPFNENGRHERGCFNPLDELDPDSRSVVVDANAIADAIITGNDRDPHWTDSARILLRALILYTLTMPKEERNLVTVRQLLTTEHPSIDITMKGANLKSGEQALFMMLAACKKYSDVSGTGKSFRDMAERERASILSSARTQTDFLADGKMQDILKSSSLRLSELKTGKTTLYLCLPATRMNTHSKWLRVIVNLAVVAMEQVKQKPDIPVLFLLDEFHVLGHMASIQTAAGLMAGFGVKLWVVLQDISQIEDHYPKTWQTFVGNSGLVTCWGVSDNATLKYMSERLGQTSVRDLQPSGATPGQRQQGASATRAEMRVQKLLDENEMAVVLERKKRRILVSPAGGKPVILQRVVYYEDGPFNSDYDPHELSAGELAAREQGAPSSEVAS